MLASESPVVGAKAAAVAAEDGEIPRCWALDVGVGS